MGSPAPQDYQYPVTNFPPAAERTAEMPMLWDEDHLKLINTCTRSESLYELYLQLPRLANDLENNQTLKDNKFSVVDTVNALRNCDWSMCELLHSMAPKVITSIVKNTIAYDNEQRDLPGFEIPNHKNAEEIPGVYVIGISMSKENGCFLNRKEMNLLIEHIEGYIEGYHAYVKYQENLSEKGLAFARTCLSIEERRAHTHMKGIDDKAGGEKTAAPVFITKDEEVPRIQALVKTLKAMCDPSLDPTGRVRMIQSPLYVGCSKNLAERIKVYNRHSLKSINKPLGITLASLKKLGYAYKLHIVCVIRTWKSDQLPLAEQLVTTLAGSLVYQHGFNATEAGGTGFHTVKSLESLKENTVYVIYRMQHLLSNVNQSLYDIEIRTRFLDDLAIVEGQVVEIKQTMELCEKELNDLPSGFQWNETLSEIEQLVQDLKKDLKDKQEALRFWNLIQEIQNIVIEETGRGIESL